MLKSPRIPILDVLRGVALVAMAIYHFGWDLSFFGYVSSAAVNDGPWKIFARCIASSFLFLVGIGLILAHANGINWNSFWKRWLKVAAAALLITVATYFFTPDAFIFFGILHQIAFASLFGLLFLRLPWWALVLVGFAWVDAAPHLKTEMLDGMHLAWTGLTTETIVSNDFVPVFPWLGAILIGMGTAKLFTKNDVFIRLAKFDISTNMVGRGLSFLGRHSLLTYLIHQPILIAFIYVYSLVYPAQIDEAALRVQFAKQCQTSCEADFAQNRCAFYCGCIETGLDEDQLFTPLMTGKIAPDNTRAQEITQQCSIDMFSVEDQ